MTDKTSNNSQDGFPGKERVFSNPYDDLLSLIEKTVTGQTDIHSQTKEETDNNPETFMDLVTLQCFGQVPLEFVGKQIGKQTIANRIVTFYLTRNAQIIVYLELTLGGTTSNNHIIFKTWEDATKFCPTFSDIIIGEAFVKTREIAYQTLVGKKLLGEEVAEIPTKWIE